MDKVIRGSTAAPLFGLDGDPTPSFADETAAPLRDPPRDPPRDSPRDPPPDTEPPSSGGAPPAAPAPEPPAPPAPPPVPLPPPASEPPAAPARCPRSAFDVPASVALALESHRPLAMAIVQRAGVPPRDAPDVVQNLLVSLLPSWAEKVDWPPRQCAEYIAGAARIVARRYRGRAARRPESLHACLPAFHEPPPENEPPRTAEELLVTLDKQAEHARETQRTFLKYSTAPAYWRVFHDHVILGLPIAGIAECEHAPIGTMYNRLRLARRDLRAAITRLRAAAARR